MERAVHAADSWDSDHREGGHERRQSLSPAFAGRRRLARDLGRDLLHTELFQYALAPPVANEIKAASSTESPTAPKKAANTKTDGAAASPERIANKDSGGPGVANPDDKVTASPGGGSLDTVAPASNLVAPDDAAPSLLSRLAGAPAADLAAPRTEPVPTPARSVDQSTPTLLGSDSPDPAPSPSSPVVKADKGDGDAVKPAPAMEAPALIAALAPSPGPPAEAAPSPAPAGDPVRLATTGDDQNKKPQDAPKSDPDSPSNPAISHPESTASELVKSEPPKSESAKVEAPPSVALGATDDPKVATASPAPPGVPVTGSEVAGAGKPPVESSAARLEAPAAVAQNAASQPTTPALTPVAPAPPLDSQVQVPDSRSQVAESKPRISDGKESDNRGPQGTLHAAQLEPSRGPIVKQIEPDARPRAIQELASAGWVSVPNSGKNLFEDATHADAPRDDSSSGVGAESAATRDVRAHAAKDVTFELEPTRARGTLELDQNGRQSVLGSGAAPEARSRSAVGRVEPNAHVVEPLENFWTISRLYYSSGRYYRALWKANADKFPEIDGLKVNDVIIIPAVEDLDPAYIDPPRARAPASLGTASKSGRRSRGSTRDNADGLAESSESSPAATRGEPISTARTNRGSGNAVPVRRSSGTDPDLDLPAADAVSRRDTAPDRTGRRIDRPLGEDEANDEPQIRTAARPRATAAASRRRPVYKIRQYDTLRSIARDMLGDSHRSSEILDLNRDLIDDPAHLIVGQVIELPDDARTSVRRSASR